MYRIDIVFVHDVIEHNVFQNTIAAVKGKRIQETTGKYHINLK